MARVSASGGGRPSCSRASSRVVRSNSSSSPASGAREAWPPSARTDGLQRRPQPLQRLGHDPLARPARQDRPGHRRADRPLGRPAGTVAQQQQMARLPRQGCRAGPDSPPARRRPTGAAGRRPGGTAAGAGRPAPRKSRSSGRTPPASPAPAPAPGPAPPDRPPSDRAASPCGAARRRRRARAPAGSTGPRPRPAASPARRRRKGRPAPRGRAPHRPGGNRAARRPDPRAGVLRSTTGAAARRTIPRASGARPDGPRPRPSWRRRGGRRRCGRADRGWTAIPGLTAHPRDSGDPGLSSGAFPGQNWVPAFAGMSGKE